MFDIGIIQIDSDIFLLKNLQTKIGEVILQIKIYRFLKIDLITKSKLYEGNRKIK